jgi:hypothetical protein
MPVRERPADAAPRSRPSGALASLLIAAQLAAALHLLVVRHSLCPLDGELVEGSAHQGQAHTRASVRPDRLPGIVARGADESTEGHEHCALTAFRRERAHHVARAAGALAPRPSVLVRAATDFTPRPPPVAVHRLAPKHSPPA